MSGVFGVVEFGGMSKEQLRARSQVAIHSLSHRGHLQTVWLSDCGRVALAQCASEPQEFFKSASGRTVMVFDGEILNYRELREQYGGLAPTKSDSELFLELLEGRGSDSFALLEGAFASAIFDQSQRKIWLAVDHAGQKSLYIYQDKNRLIFSSEIKAIRAFGQVDLEISTDSIAEYLVLGFAPNPRTVFKRITRLSPASYKMIDLLDGPNLPQKYWDLPILGPQLQGSPSDLQMEFKKLLQKSVKKRLSGQAVGVLLSGGIDSSAIALEASSLGTQEKLKTFSLGFLKSSTSEIKDESQYARLVAAKIHSDHSESQVDYDNGQFDQLLRHLDQPVATSWFLPYSFLFAESARYMKFGLVGFGSGILFGGLRDLHMTLTIDEHLERLRFLLNWWPFKKLSEKTKSHIRFPFIQRLLGMESIFTERELKKLLGAQLEGKLQEADRLEKMLIGIERDRKALYASFHQTLCAQTLPLVDSLSSLSGLNLRFPFLDKDIIEFAARLPSDLRVDGRATKGLVRSAYREILGAEIAGRAKAQDYFPLTDFLEQRIKGEDFSKLAQIGISTDGYQFQVESVPGQKKFLNLYVLEGFLKHHEIGSGVDDALTFKDNLNSILSEVRDRPLEFFELPADLKID